MRAAIYLLILLISAACAARAADAPKPDVTFHAKPKLLAAGAVIEDWGPFLGARHNGTSAETHLLKKFPDGGLSVVWEMEHGMSYASPAISGGRLVYFHRVANEEIAECRDAETGARLWRFAYPTDFQDRFGYNNGPRCSPVIDGEYVYLHGAVGMLHCLKLKDGAVVWKHDTFAEFKLQQNFFGVGSTPLIEGGLLIVNVGAPNGQSVAAFDKLTGEKRWTAGEWGPGYASPVPADIHGKRRVLVFAGGDSKPPTGGLLCIDPLNGAVDFSFPWRSKSYESVNAALPTICGDQVFVTASYDTGGTMVTVTPEFKAVQAWKTDELGAHFSTCIFREGLVYGFDGRHTRNAQLTCIEVKTGKTLWRDPLIWQETVELNGEKRPQRRGAGRGSLLLAEGQFLCLGEFGDLLRLELSPDGCMVLERTRLFDAQESWSPLVLSHGLLYAVQNSQDQRTQAPPRLICVDLRE